MIHVPMILALRKQRQEDPRGSLAAILDAKQEKSSQKGLLQRVTEEGTQCPPLVHIQTHICVQDTTRTHTLPECIFLVVIETP